MNTSHHIRGIALAVHRKRAATLADVCNFQCDPLSWTAFGLALAFLAALDAAIAAILLALWLVLRVVEWWSAVH